jgi:hypothetical protein
MKPITREELDKWKKLAEAATAGPWKWHGITQFTDYFVAGDVTIPVSERAERACGRYSHRMDVENAEFIAAARDAVPRLVAEVERLRDMISCERCEGDVENPQIDEYGEGPICDACLEDEL